MSRLEWLVIRAIWLGMAVLTTLAFDAIMDADARHLCDNDATADAGVCEQGYGR